MRMLLLSLLLLPLCACATPGATDLSRAEADPWEKSNRRIYAFNKRLDRYAIRPLSQGYRAVVPQAGRTAIGNAYRNYGEPANFLNAVLQGKIDQAMRTVDRFIVNSTLGVAGINDVATDLGRPREPEDFGQTFARWGIKSGPYLVLPLFGPSTLRDGLATPLDFFIDPADFARNALLSPTIPARAAQISLRIVDFRAQLTDAGGDKLLADSLDEYTLVKSAFLQRRRALLFDGNPPESDDPFAEPEDAATPNPAPPPEAPAEAPAEPVVTPSPPLPPPEAPKAP
ncbi:VacJ family lipoprotein [Sandarakinorhabdus sp.]|uniref:MlaA family lipoprotein n=1 Tax=Sandarakinorhabdus sp. TaxID=1916663 RepID=UPI00286DDE1F|nr:VacJ family lipoprotein [Sandarakinorhabdus sp.]